MARLLALLIALLLPGAPGYRAVGGRLILLRHGQSIWNRAGRFTGWANVALSPRGEREAVDAAELLLGAPLPPIDLCYTSVLSRCTRTAELCLDAYCLGLGLPRPQTRRRWRLNERHYGALTGQNKRTALRAFDKQQLEYWRQSFNGQPPPMEPPHSHYSRVPHRYERLLAAADHADEPLRLGDVPLTESLAATRERVRPLWRRELLPAVLSGATVLCVGHANSLRMLISCIQPELCEADLPSLSLPNALPLVFAFDANGAPLVDRSRYCYVPPIRGHYLGDACLDFASMDANGSGQLDPAELDRSDYCQLMYEAVEAGFLEIPAGARGMGGAEGEACGQLCGELLLEEADANGDGSINFNEWQSWQVAGLSEEDERIVQKADDHIGGLEALG